MRNFWQKKERSKMSKLYSNQPWYLQNHFSTSVHVAEGCKLKILSIGASKCSSQNKS